MDELPANVQSPPVADRTHEGSDVSIRGLAIFLAGLAIVLVVVGGIVAWLFDLFLDQARRTDLSPSPLAAPDRRTAGPLLQVAERRDLEALRAREHRRLHQTEWIDRGQGIVRIPIERAIELTAERGLPRWPSEPAPEKSEP